VEENKGDDYDGGNVITDTYNYPEFDYENDNEEPYHASVVDNNSFERAEVSPRAFHVVHETIEEHKNKLKP